jgi:serine/threonine-protein kinase
MLRGLDLIRQAIVLDPESALAQAGLGFCLQYAAFFGYVQPREIMEEANRAVQRAIELDRDMAEAWASFAGVRYYLNFDMAASELAIERALSLNPSHSRSLVHYSWQLGEMGRFDEALEMSKWAISLDPLSPYVRTTTAQSIYLSRDFESAIVEYEKILKLDPGDPAFHYYLAWAREQSGDYDKAIALHQRAIEFSDRAPIYIGGLGYSYGLARRNGEAQKILDELILLEAKGLAQPYDVAIVHIGIGNNERALDWLEKAYDARNSHMIYIKQSPQFDPLRDNPRFVSLIQRMGW